MIPMVTHTGLVAHVITPPKVFIRPVALHNTQCMVWYDKSFIKHRFEFSLDLIRTKGLNKTSGMKKSDLP